MKQLAGVVASIGLVLAAWVALAPISVEAPFADGRCGAPVIRVAAREHVDDPNAQEVIDRCEEAAIGRLVLAGTALGAGLVGFVVLRVVARRRAQRDRRRRRRSAAAASHPPPLGSGQVSS